jgi:hypothetical protein
MNGYITGKKYNFSISIILTLISEKIIESSLPMKWLFLFKTGIPSIYPE